MEDRALQHAWRTRDCLKVFRGRVISFNRRLHSQRNYLEGASFHKVNLAGAQETGQLREELERLQVKLRQAEDRRDALQEDIESYQSGFVCSKSTTQRMVEDALEEAGLLDPPEPDSPPRSTAGSMDETAEYGEDTAPSNDNESIAMAEAPTEEELLRRAACKDLDKSRRAQRDAQIAFDGRKESYGQMNFDRHRDEGRMDYTRSEFDVEHDFK